MNQPPSVSVTTRTRNRADYLRLTVASILAQSFQTWELIISDDASSDETSKLCERWQKEDARIHYFRHEPNLGASNNWRFCLARSSNTYFSALDDDNLYLPDFLAKSVEALEGAPEAAFTFCDEWRVDDQGIRDANKTEKSSQHYHRSELAEGICPDTPLSAVWQAPGINSALFRREALASAGGFRELAGDFADFDVFLNLARHGFQGYYLPERLVEYREHSNQDGGTYLTSIPKSRSAIRILEASTFQGAAEEARRQKLAQAYVTLSRVMLLHQDFPAARQAIQKASALQPGHLRTRLLSSLLQMPNPILSKGLQMRYGRDLKRVEG